MAGLPLPSPTHSEVSESVLSSEDTIKSSGRKKKLVLCGSTLIMIPKTIGIIEGTSSDRVCEKKFRANSRLI